MKFSIYLTTIAILVLTGIITVATINYTVDPAGIYHETDDFTYKFVSQLVASKNGLLIKSNTLNERDVAITLAEYPVEVSCYVIGSSRVMQIGSSRQQNSLVHNCPTLINLGVSGGTLEDYVALSGAISRNTNEPKTIVIGIDPWSLNYRRDARWIRYENEYTSMLEKIQNTSNNLQKYPLVANLINLEYFIRSISNINSTEKTIIHAPDFDQSIGIEEAVRLPDHSLVYSKKNIQSNNESIITGIHDYKIIKNHWYNEGAVQLFVQLVTHLLQQRFNVILLMTPYHPAVWKHKEQPVVTAMRTVEDKVHEIAKSANVKAIGSFNPDKIGCTSGEFYDAMHATDKCMTKLENMDLKFLP